MADLWLPGFTINQLKAGGTYDDTRNPKLGWHTWEGTSWAAAETAFRNYPPHIACKPPHPGIPASEVGKRQYVPLNRHAHAFAGSENDDEYIIQVEVAGRADEAHGWTDLVCEWLYEEIVAPLEQAVGIPPIVVPGGFFDQTNYRPAVAANYLASAKSEIRLTAAELRAFSGHLGHQHMPPPDTHYDPGRLPIDRILSHTTTGDDLMGAADDILEEIRAVRAELRDRGITGSADLDAKPANARSVIERRVSATYSLVTQIAKAATDDDVDEAKIAELVLAGLDPAAIAAAIPAGIAKDVADELAARLGA